MNTLKNLIVQTLKNLIVQIIRVIFAGFRSLFITKNWYFVSRSIQG